MSKPPFVFHQPKHAHPEEDTHALNIPAIPDLRFEHSYLRSIRPFVTIRNNGRSGELDDDSEQDNSKWLDGQTFEKVGPEGHRGESMNMLKAQTTEIVSVAWGSVAWVTLRDQVISPLLQGALWGVAGHFLRPLLTHYSRNVKSRFAGEGSGVTWLRGWTHGLGLGTGGHNARTL